MPAVETKYKFNGKRAVAGLSMGGFGTLYYGLKYPEKFTYAYSMSPAASYDMFKMLVDAQQNKSVFPAFTIEVGNQDTTVNNEEARKCADYMSEQGLTVEYIARDGIHYWNFWQECLPKALSKAGESFK
jgi:S-formylglutathione hydrolase FrmB